jgi:hypothetical protein
VVLWLDASRLQPCRSASPCTTKPGSSLSTPLVAGLTDRSAATVAPVEAGAFWSQHAITANSADSCSKGFRRMVVWDKFLDFYRASTSLKSVIRTVGSPFVEIFYSLPLPQVTATAHINPTPSPSQQRSGE